MSVTKYYVNIWESQNMNNYLYFIKIKNIYIMIHSVSSMWQTDFHRAVSSYVRMVDL